MTQTEGSERLKQFSIAETQTDLKETANNKCQTDRADAINVSSQTKIFECNEEGVQTERNDHSKECQTALPINEMECQTSFYTDSETISESLESERRQKNGSDLIASDSIDGETGNKALKFKAQTTRAAHRVIQFPNTLTDAESPSKVSDTSDNKLSNKGPNKNQIDQDYMKNRDPMKEFFALVSAAYL